MKYWITAFFIVAADQISKLLVRLNLRVGESIAILGDFFRITHVENTGAAFNSLAGQRTVLLLLPLLFIVLCIIFLCTHKGEHWIVYIGTAMIIAGGIGNLIDRAIFGSVTDMLSFSIFPPVFNLADIGVTLGCALLLLGVAAGEKLKKQRE